MKRLLPLALLLVAVLAPAASAAPAPAKCMAFTDPAGDEGPTPDPSLDVLSASLKTNGKALVATVTVKQWAVHPLLAPDSRTDVNFTVSGQNVTLFYKSNLKRDAEANGFHQQGIRVDDVFSSEDLTAAVSGNTLTITVRFKALMEAVGHPVLGKPFTNVAALARANYVYSTANETWDTATPPASLRYVGGAACR